MITLIASAVALSLQAEAGVMEMKNPIDDQYVEYHAGPGFSSGVQMTSPVAGLALRLEPGAHFVATVGARDMGHQRIDTDIVSDEIYFKCRFHYECKPKIERWYTRMSTQQVYASVGYKLHVRDFDIVPTVGLADNGLTTSVEVTRPYAWHHGMVTWYSSKQHEKAPFVGLDVERGAIGAGIYYLQTTNRIPIAMGDPGQGRHAFLTRVTYRFKL